MAKYENAALQNNLEFARFTTILQREGVKKYLEIGSKHGGALWRAANALPIGSTIVSVDLPHGDGSFKESEPWLRACVDKLKSLGYDAHLYLGDSTNAEIIEMVRRHAPFDAIFIDANHTLPFVTKDWNAYGPMSRIVAFHDINWKPRPEPSKKMPIEVPMLWNEIKKQYRHEEIKLDERDNGIGILWRDSPTNS